MVDEDREKRKFLSELTSDALSHVHHGKKEEALACYDKILEKYPGEISAIYGKGITHYQFDELNIALSYFDNVLKLDPHEKESLYAKGTILSNLGQIKEAIEYLDKAINVDPKFDIAWLAKGYTLIDLNKLEQALDCFGKVEKLGRKEMVYTGKGHALRKLNRLKEAKANYQFALHTDAYDSEALFGLGVIEYKENNIKEAKDLLSKSVIQDDTNLEAWELLAEVFNQIKDKEREKIALEKISELKEK
ncbi:MAG: tetratricopeptide repeat protein [Candidatus Heimdallarchaeota archaeon]|nr:tetratricopeptide repeat protein [Candidatus Heimdallarchaeota archaeon]